MFEKYIPQLRNYYKKSEIELPFQKYTLLLKVIPPLIFFNLLILILVFIPEPTSKLILILASFILSIFSFFLILLYPYDRYISRKKDLEENLPYALNYLSTLADAGIPPLVMFETLSRFKEYGEVSRQSLNIVKQVKIFGRDLNKVLLDKAKEIHSETFSEILSNLAVNLHSGGDIKSFLKQKYNELTFKQLLEKSKFERFIEIFGNIYTILFVITPLLLFVLIMVGEIIAPTIMGPIFLKTFIYILLPALNLIFWGFIRIFSG
jgi:flagellar protein FlaJ